MNSTAKRVLIGTSALVLSAAIVSPVVLILYVLTPPIRSFTRMHENLPAVSIENGDTIYCRMRYCDFRFPLPAKASIVRSDPVTGGADTINGAIYVVGPDGRPISVRSYAEFLEKNHWNVTMASGVGCPAVTNDCPDTPFVSSKGVIHYPLFDQVFAGQAEQEGGGIIIETGDIMTRIRFSYFGDY